MIETPYRNEALLRRCSRTWPRHALSVSCGLTLHAAGPHDTVAGWRSRYRALPADVPACSRCLRLSRLAPDRESSLRARHFAPNSAATFFGLMLGDRPRARPGRRPCFPRPARRVALGS
jgi:hypothetical protein